MNLKKLVKRKNGYNKGIMMQNGINDHTNFEIEISNLIEKVAVWYELKYPDNKMDGIDINLNTNKFDTSEFYSIDLLIKSLSPKERKFIIEPQLSLKNGDAYFELTSKGIIKNIKNLNTLPIWLNDNERKNIDKIFEGKNIDDLIIFLKKRGGECEKLNKIIVDYNSKICQRKSFLNCVMSRIIERGGNIIGVNRALLFAKEFDISVINNFYSKKRYVK